MLLALGISSIESTQAFIFYLTQYSISNLNAFMILIAIGYSLYCYTSNNKEHKELLDKNNSPLQLINQLKGYYLYKSIISYKFSYNYLFIYGNTSSSRILWKTDGFKCCFR